MTTEHDVAGDIRADSTGPALEQAIAPELRRERTCPLHVPNKNWTPPYPSFSARFDKTLTAIGMLMFGLQVPREKEASDDILRVRKTIKDRVGAAGTIRHSDEVTFIDQAGLTNFTIIAYCEDNSDSRAKARQLQQDWMSEEHRGLGVGFYVEQLWPTLDRVETLYSSSHLQGVAFLADKLSGEILEHGYWGSARDRLPAAQTDPLESNEENNKGRLPANLCLIRSGQDWTTTSGDERAMYEDQVEPVLRAGMDFLRLEGQSIGCFANRYARVLNAEGKPMDQSFGLSWWNTMQDLDDWARDHPTHKAIFGVAMKYLSKFGGDGNLKLTHEVFVVRPDQYAAQYMNCLQGTGLSSLMQA